MILLMALCGALYFAYLGSTPFFDKGEPREALAVQDIVQRGEWLVPLKKATDIPSKPPLFHWGAAAISLASGRLSEATIRLPSAVYATLGVLLIYVLGRRLFGADVAFLGAAILATTTIYQNQALSARVDMTLCFFVTMSLALFYSLYRGFLAREIWYYVFFALVGISVLAKGPLGIVLPALVAGLFVIFKKRWDLVSKFCFHPGVVVALMFATAWYLIAVTRGGEGFFDRQIVEENLSRFAGGSGHSSPFYYYIPYVFALGLPWSLFLPFLLWDSFKNGFLSDDESLFLKIWFLAMFAFFSVSLGKRSVYILPIYPAISLLMAYWFYHHSAAEGTRRALYRLIAVLAGAMGLVLIVVTMGTFWNHNPGWFFSPIEGVLKPKDRANLLVVKNALATFGWLFTVVSLLSGVLWLCLARSLYVGRLRAAAWQLVLVSVPVAFITRAIVMPVIAEGKSYREFMSQVNQRVIDPNRLFLYGSFNSDPVVFYRGSPIETLDQPLEKLAPSMPSGEVFIIMPEQLFLEMRKQNRNLPMPLLKSVGKGPEGDARLVLLQLSGSHAT